MNRAILHFDGDSFFASVEQIMNHTLRGKSVVTGGERGAITSVSIQGKRRGVNRGMTMSQARALASDLVVVASDYTSYSIFARRMYTIVREFTPYVEEYSIDECFADITDLRDRYSMSYEGIACMIKEKLEANLGITFGVGLAPNKVLAKVASKHRKPGGFTSIYAKNKKVQTRKIHDFLKELSIGKIWGIGSSSSVYLSKLGIRSALDFALKEEEWCDCHKIAKPYREILQELKGEFVKPLSVHTIRADGSDDSIGSIIKSRTFSPPSNDRSYIFSQLSKNIENACIKARRYKVKARYVRFYLKTQEFTYKGLEFALTIPVSTPHEIIQIIEKRFDEVYRPNVLYRATGISLSAIITEDRISYDLFGESRNAEKSEKVFSVVDALSRKYGKHTLFLGSSLQAFNDAESGQKSYSRQSGPVARQEFALIGDRRKKSLEIPFLGKVL